MSNYVPRQTVRSILRRMVRRPWHSDERGRILDWNNRPIARVVDEDCVEARLITMAPELALAYVEIADECEQLREEVEDLHEQLEAVEGRKDREIA